jgi:hypothetical protein
MDFQIWIVLLGVIVLGILFYVYFKPFRLKRDLAKFELAADVVCKEYSLQRQFLPPYGVRVYRMKGETIIYDKTFFSFRELRKEFPKR